MRGVETDKRFVTERQNDGTLKALKLTVPATVKIGRFLTCPTPALEIRVVDTISNQESRLGTLTFLINYFDRVEVHASVHMV